MREQKTKTQGKKNKNKNYKIIPTPCYKSTTPHLPHTDKLCYMQHKKLCISYSVEEEKLIKKFLRRFITNSAIIVLRKEMSKILCHFK